MKKSNKTLARLMEIEEAVIVKSMNQPNRPERFIPQINFCVWTVERRLNKDTFRFKTEHETIVHGKTSYEYCPYCGNMILSVENEKS